MVATLSLPFEAQARQQQEPQSVNRAAAVGGFVAGAAVGLLAHESGHLFFDVIFDADPEVRRVDFHGIPFFAISPQSPLSDREEFTVSSAGFWVQHATNEWLLTRRPRLRSERAPFAKGVFAFNIGASAAYSAAAFARTGPVERDTRGMASVVRDRRAMDRRVDSRARGPRYVEILRPRCETADLVIACGEDPGRAADSEVTAPRQARAVSPASGAASLRGPSANVIVPSTATLPSTRAIPRSTPTRLRRRRTVASISTTSPGCTGRR